MTLPFYKTLRVFQVLLISAMVFPCGSTLAANNNLSFDGTLVSEPCNLDPATSEITVDFGTVIDKELYKYARTAGKPFTINLTECDPSLANSVTMTFSGTESSALPGFLAVTGTPGVTIGMESSTGTPVPFNKPSPASQIFAGNNSVTFNAFVQAEPDAISQHTIATGSFSSIATFEMAYQ